MKKLIVLVVLFVVSFTNLMSQDMSSVYSAWGFSAPFLKSGEFVLTGRGSYYSSDSDSKYSYGYSSMYESSSSQLYLRGVLALSDKFLINTTFYFYPETDNSGKSGDASYTNNNVGSRKSYLYPSFTLIYRPMKNFEVAGNIYSYNYDQNTNYTYSNPNNDPYSYKSTYKTAGGSISVNYFGKLWNK